MDHPKRVSPKPSKARDIETNLTSKMFKKTKKKDDGDDDEESDEKEENIFTTRPIYENVPVSELQEEKHKDCIIIYNQNHLNEELDQIIELYNVIPTVRNQKFKITSIKVAPKGKGHTNPFLNKNLLLVVDPNDTDTVSYREVRDLCSKHGVLFKNQSFSQLVKQIRQELEERKSKRHTFTEKEREDLHTGFKGKCNCCKKKVDLKKMHIDHIEPLACGGTNDLNSLPVLCKPCHHEKTQEENKFGYVKLSETESSFNLTTQEMFNSEVCRSYAFVEYVCPESMAYKYKLKQYHIDINKCRANQLLYSISQSQFVF
jgi:5-methylcytosine-specific restriction endonuclease McrA